MKCSGQIFVGMFFDGTGNNEERDYLSVKGKPQEHKHSNVVRLYHAYPDQLTRGTARYYGFYVPGVGTPFPEINDGGGALGTGMSWNGEPRLIWGITRMFNAVSDFVSRKNLIDDALAGRIAHGVGGVGSTALHREFVFKSTWTKRLKQLVEQRDRTSQPEPEQINLSVFGFSRGAAEARAFVNWLYAICEVVDGTYCFAGIPLRVEFLGIFDTVASVGLAGGFSSGLLSAEGRQSWAADNMQVHKGVERCLHIVAAHEVRATFPLDSVRIDGRYPPNVKEYVYPGAHSDVGGGYSATAQGKTDALARVAGFEMYCAALAAGVPFLTLSELGMAQKQSLVPSQKAVEAFQGYMGAARISPGPVEEMARAHMGHYFSYRYQARRKPYCHQVASEYGARGFFKKATAEQEYLRDTQQYFTAILAAVAATMDHVMRSNSAFDKYFGHPFQNKALQRRYMPGNSYSAILADRIQAVHDQLDNGQHDQLADRIETTLKKWKTWLSDHNYPLLQDEDAPERDVLSVIARIDEAPQGPAIYTFFDHWVHDSMAGLAKDKVNEFLINGIGMFKFRRVYFGDKGDEVLRHAVEARNKVLRDNARAKRAQRRQWDLESAEFARTRW